MITKAAIMVPGVLIVERMRRLEWAVIHWRENVIKAKEVYMH